jgi:hypothetical protein
MAKWMDAILSPPDLIGVPAALGPHFDFRFPPRQIARTIAARTRVIPSKTRSRARLSAHDRRSTRVILSKTRSRARLSAHDRRTKPRYYVKNAALRPKAHDCARFLRPLSANI